MPSLRHYQDYFLKNVEATHLTYEWTDGHAYALIDHPIMDVTFKELQGEDGDEWYQFTHNWIAEHEESLPRCIPPLLERLASVAGKTPVKACKSCFEPQGQDQDVDYIRGFLSQVKIHSPEEILPEHIELLEEWLEEQAFQAQISTLLGDTRAEGQEAIRAMKALLESTTDPLLKDIIQREIATVTKQLEAAT